MQYYRSLFAIIFLRFSIFSIIFLRLERLAQTSYTQFLINTKLQNNKSNNEILLKRAYAFFFYI